MAKPIQNINSDSKRKKETTNQAELLKLCKNLGQQSAEYLSTVKSPRYRYRGVHICKDQGARAKYEAWVTLPLINPDEPPVMRFAGRGKTPTEAASLYDAYVRRHGLNLKTNFGNP